MFSKLVNYIKEAYYELKKVNWPSRQETIRLTIMVIGISLGLAAFLGIIDFGLKYVLEQLLI